MGGEIGLLRVNDVTKSKMATKRTVVSPLDRSITLESDDESKHDLWIQESQVNGQSMTSDDR